VAKVDMYLEWVPHIACLSIRLLDLQSHADSCQRWFQHHQTKLKLGEHSVFEYFCVLPVFVLTQQVEVSAEAFASAGLTWENSESMPTKSASSFQWNLDERAFCLHPQTVIILTKLGLLFTSPQLVEQAEVSAFLPSPGECKYLKDRMNVVNSLSEPLGALFAKAALEATNDENGSELHAKSHLANHLNLAEIKNMHAKYALSSSLVRSEDTDMHSS